MDQNLEKLLVEHTILFANTNKQQAVDLSSFFKRPEGVRGNVDSILIREDLAHA